MATTTTRLRRPRRRRGTSRFDAFADRLHAGAKAPSFPLTRLDDAATVELAELWRRDPVVAEFGSFT